MLVSYVAHLPTTIHRKIRMVRACGQTISAPKSVLYLPFGALLHPVRTSRKILFEKPNCARPSGEGPANRTPTDISDDTASDYHSKVR